MRAKRGRGRPRKPKTPDFLVGFNFTPGCSYDNFPWGADPWVRSRTPASNKGNVNFLGGQQWVSIEVAMEFLAVGRRAVQIAMKKGKLDWKDSSRGRLISTESLLRPS